MPHSHDHIDGKCDPSVTEIIHSQPKPFLEKWRMKYGDRLCDKKLEWSNLIGTDYHRCVEEITQGKVPIPRYKRVKGMINTFNRDWFSVTAVAPYGTEMKVYSRKYGFQGTLDFVGEINHTPKVLDHKSSSGINEDMGMQLAAYAQAYYEMTGFKFKIGEIILVKKKKPHFKLVTKEFDLTKKKYLKNFLQLREELVELPCPYKSN